MNFLREDLLNHLSKELEIDVDDITQAFETFTISPSKGVTPKVKGKTVVTSKVTTTKPTTKPNTKVINKKVATVAKKGHECERIKKGQTEPCGKNALRSINDDDGEHWYCGSEKSSGCYKSELNIRAALEAKANIKSDKTVTVKGKSQKAPVKNSADIAKNLLKSISQAKTLNVINVHSETHGKLLMAKDSRALCEKDVMMSNGEMGTEFYGILDEDDETILPLDKTTIRMLESNGQNIRQEKVSNKQVKHISRDKTPVKATIVEATVESEASSEEDALVESESLSESDKLSDESEPLEESEDEE